MEMPQIQTASGFDDSNPSTSTQATLLKTACKHANNELLPHMRRDVALKFGAIVVCELQPLVCLRESVGFGGRWLVRRVKSLGVLIKKEAFFGISCEWKHLSFNAWARAVLNLLREKSRNPTQ